MPLLLLFVIVPLVELMLLLKLADVISGTWTFALVVFTGFLGATLARRQGWGVLHRLQTEVQAGQMPTTTVVDALMIFVAGALLITPGILTDVFGFSLLVPVCRRAYRGALMRWFKNNVKIHSRVHVQRHWGGGPNDPAGDVLESEIIDARVIDAHVVPTDDEPHERS